MRENPCRYCALSSRYKNKYRPGWLKECWTCQNLKIHQEYLRTQRKYEPGELITNIQDLLKETWVMWYGKTKHIETFKSMQLRTVIQSLDHGAIRKAISKKMR